MWSCVPFLLGLKSVCIIQKFSQSDVYLVPRASITIVQQTGAGGPGCSGIIRKTCMKSFTFSRLFLVLVLDYAIAFMALFHQIGFWNEIGQDNDLNICSILNYHHKLIVTINNNYYFVILKHFLCATFNTLNYLHRICLDVEAF